MERAVAFVLIVFALGWTWLFRDQPEHWEAWLLGLALPAWAAWQVFFRRTPRRRSR